MFEQIKKENLSMQMNMTVEQQKTEVGFDRLKGINAQGTKEVAPSLFELSERIRSHFGVLPADGAGVKKLDKNSPDFEIEYAPMPRKFAKIKANDISGLKAVRTAQRAYNESVGSGDEQGMLEGVMDACDAYLQHARSAGFIDITRRGIAKKRVGLIQSLKKESIDKMKQY